MGWLLNEYYKDGEDMLFVRWDVNSANKKLKDYTDEQINLEILYYNNLTNIDFIQKDCLFIFNDMVVKRRKRKIQKIKDRI